MNVRKVIGLIGGISSYFLFASPAFAVDVNICPTESGLGALCSQDPQLFGTIVKNAITILLILAIIIAVFFLIYGGIKWILSGGDKQALEGARNHIIAAIVGLVIALLAFFILQFALGLFGLEETTTFTLPSLIKK